MTSINIRRPLAIICVIYISLIYIYINIRGYPYVDISEVVESGHPITIEGYVQEKNIKDDKYILMLEHVRSDIELICRKKNIGVVCYLDEEELASYMDMPEIGSYVRITGRPSTFNVPSNPGEFDMQKYYAAKGYYFSIFKGKVEAKSDTYNKYREGLFNLERRLGEAFSNIFNEVDSGILKAMLLGDKGGLDTDIKTLFQSGGISHILSISGLHISIIGMCIFRLFSKIRIPGFISAPLSVVIMISYYFMTGMSTSTFRAVCMFAIMLGALMLRRSYDILTALAVAAASLVISNPYILMYAGFWLSFLAVLGISVFTKAVCISEDKFIVPDWINRKCKKYILKAVNGLISGMSISFFTLPIVLLYYYEFPLYSILINLLVIPLMTVLLVLAIVAGILSYIGLGIVARIIGMPCTIILWLYKNICAFVRNLPGNHLVFGRPETGRIVVFYILVLLIVGLFNIEIRLKKKSGKVRKGKVVHIAKNILHHRILINVFLMIFAVLVLMPYKHGLNIIMIDVGQGDGILMYTSRAVYMIDGGSSSVSKLTDYKLEPCIKSQGVSCIDYWFISHPDMDHISGLVDILGDDTMYGMKIKNIVLPGSGTINDDARELIELARTQGVNVCLITRGDEISDKKLHIRCLGPGADKDYSDDINSYSEILYVTYDDFDILFTGDATVSSEEEYLQFAGQNNIDISNITLLKVSHHGSNTSSSEKTLDILKPHIALISCGLANRYGHPHAEIVERLGSIGSRIYRTDYQGAIMIWTNGKRMKIDTYKQETY